MYDIYLADSKRGLPVNGFTHDTGFKLDFLDNKA
jgi:hypothetical protein